jgi:hypothetical protein
MYNGHMNKQPTPFLIAFVQPVAFHDMGGNLTKRFETGDVIHATADTGTHYVTTMGGIYHDEARRVDGEELITYAHQNGDGKIRFRQHAKDTLPPWAVDFKLDTEG